MAAEQAPVSPPPLGAMAPFKRVKTILVKALNFAVIMAVAVLTLDVLWGVTTRYLFHEQSSWTDYFIIATVTSQTHMRGIVRYVNGFLHEHSIEPLRRRKRVDEEGWILIDCGDFVVHLMTQENRDFYELERLWYSGKKLYHSSKSS